MGEIKTYNPKKVTVTLGSHLASGLADDSFITIEPAGDGVTYKYGCDGEIIRSITPDDTYTIKISVLQYSETNKFLQQKYAADQSDASGMFSVLIKDLRGGQKFSAAYAWVTKPASKGYGKESNNREWEIHTGSGTITE